MELKTYKFTAKQLAYIYKAIYNFINYTKTHNKRISTKLLFKLLYTQCVIESTLEPLNLQLQNIDINNLPLKNQVPSKGLNNNNNNNNPIKQKDQCLPLDTATQQLKVISRQLNEMYDLQLPLITIDDFPKYVYTSHLSELYEHRYLFLIVDIE